jgi:hypothetical protein
MNLSPTANIYSHWPGGVKRFLQMAAFFSQPENEPQCTACGNCARRFVSIFVADRLCFLDRRTRSTKAHELTTQLNPSNDS